MKNLFTKIREKLGKNSSKKNSEETMFQGKFEPHGENEYLYKNYHQEVKIKKIGENKFSIGEIIDTEKNIKFIADYINKAKDLAGSYQSAIDWNIASLQGISFQYNKKLPDYGVSVVFNWEFDTNEEMEDGEIYESGYGKSEYIIEKKKFEKMPEKQLIINNADNIVKYLNAWAKERGIDSMTREEIAEEMA